MVQRDDGAAPPGWRVAPVVLAEQARVALGDDIAHAMGARMMVVLVGERPGMSAADSLGAYLTYAPRPGTTTDADRNCLSNIRPPLGLAYATAAAKLAALMGRARELGRTGVVLKDESAESTSRPRPLPSLRRRSRHSARAGGVAARPGCVAAPRPLTEAARASGPFRRSSRRLTAPRGAGPCPRSSRQPGALPLAPGSVGHAPPLFAGARAPGPGPFRSRRARGA